MKRRSLLLLALLPLSGCMSLGRATHDETRLRGDVPAGLGRALAVRVDGAPDGETEGELLRALEREFTGQDLFDRVEPLAAGAAGPTGGSSGLWVTVLSASAEDVFDMIQLETAFVARYELEVELRDRAGAFVLGGHVSGVGADPVTDDEFLQGEKQTDVRLAALNDAAAKMSRALRAAAASRATKAMESLPKLTFPPGVGPIGVAVLGFDEDEGARRRRGGLLRDKLGQALRKLGAELEVTPEVDVARALEHEEPGSLFQITSYQLDGLVQRLPRVRLFVVGRLSLVGGKVATTIRVLDPTGTPVTEVSADAEGLGALPVVAVKLARRIAEWLGEHPPG